MFRFDHDLRIYLHRQSIDFRAGLARALFGSHSRKRDP